MRTRSLRPVVVWALLAQLTAIAQFVAYNDHAPGPGTGPNTTTYDVFGNAPGNTGLLKNSVTGANVPVTLTITTEGAITASGTQGLPSPGTPVYETFNGFVDFQGSPSPSVELTPGVVVTYAFTGLDPKKRYSFAGSAVRGGDGYTDRWTLFALEGAVSFTGAHTRGVLTNAIVPLISANQAALNTGMNHTPESGDMVVWTDIDPGPEGTISIVCQQYTGPVPDGSSAGIKGYSMTGMRLEEFDATLSGAQVLIGPQSQTIEEGKAVTFRVIASGNPAPTYQWYKNDVAIPGATSFEYTIQSVQVADDNARFKAIASNTVNGVPFTSVSSEAILDVIGDTTPPTLIDAQALGLVQVRVTFSEPVTDNTAKDPANYTITGGGNTLPIMSIGLDSQGTNVLLMVNALAEGITYTLSVSGIRDRSGAGNLIAPNSQRIFAAATYTTLDIGSPIIAGSVVAKPNGYDISGSGADIGGTRDQFHFGYQQKTGDFDMQVRVADLTITDAYVKAGLMVRESLIDTSRFAAVFASSAQLGSFFESRSTSVTLTGPALKFPSNYPWAWLRLRRIGNDFTGFGSFDGNEWQQLGTINLTMPAQMFFGMAVTSGMTNALATAKFRDIGPVTSADTFTYTPTRESVGPSSRRSGILISEVMYHARPRGDNRILDFVEIYNGEPIFVDLTGWKIAGGIEYSFPEGFRIAAGQFVVIASDPATLMADYGITGVLGPYAGNLNNRDDTIILLNRAGAVRSEFTYSSEPPWPASPDGSGHSLVCLKPSYGEDDFRAWGPSQLIGGSPGFDDPIVPHPWAGIVINEFLAVSATPNSGFIELYNASNAAVDLSGCFLTDSITQNKYRINDGTSLEGRSWISFTQQQLGFTLSSAGGTIYLVSADQSRVLDSIRFGAQEPGVSFGRAPDGSPLFRRLASATPGQLNAARKQEDIVINEVMYKPISSLEEDEYVELYNRSANAINLSGWRFNAGINFTFPAGTSIAANGYLVVARDLQRMLLNYPQLNTNNTVGDFSGQLQGGGELLALGKPGINPSEFITVSEVFYFTGGRWPDLANGGGSSLELRDTEADPAFGPNWAASDETQKSTWKTYETTSTLTLANQAYPASKVFIMGQDKAEFLVDDIEILRSGTNVVSNAGFESGQSGWLFFGTHRFSTVQNTGAFAGNNCLHVIASETGDEGPNSIRGNMTGAFTQGQSVTIRTKARWLAGWPEFLLRIRGNGIELPVRLELPKNLGTPGLANSRKIDNVGPAITEVTHFPTMPAVNQAVVVSARIADADGVNLPQLIYRNDPGSTLTTLAMRDDGTGGDLLAGDGIFAATIPGRSTGLIAFRVQAQDGAATPVTSLFPIDAPQHEALIRWGDATPLGSLGHYHLWSTATSQNDLTSRPGQERTYRDCTLVYDTRVIYNSGWRNKGSPFHSGVGSYSMSFPEDDLFLGTDKHVLRATGNGGTESTQMAVDVSYWIAERMGLPFNHSRYVRLYRNGTLHYPIDYDMEVPDRSVARDWFGGGGVDDTLYKIAGWFEYDDSNNGGTGSLIWANATKKPTTAPPYKTAAYRFNWQTHAGGVTANDYSLIFNLITAANATDKITQLINLADMENWMRTFAHRRILGDWDHWSFSTGQNMYLYAPLGERARLMPWDADFVLGLGEGATSANLFSAGQDGTVGALFNVPAYRRMLWRAYTDAVNGPLEKATSDAQFDARRNMLLKNNVSGTAPTSLKTYVAARRNTILTQIRAGDPASFALTTADFTTANPIATITGIAPYPVASIEVNGTPVPVTWTSATAFRINVPLGGPTNVLEIVGKNLRGDVHTNSVKQVTVTYTGAIPNVEDWVVINEIMYNAALTDAQFIEIYNSHPSYTFDLSGCKLKGADFTFPGGSFIPANSYLVIAKDSAFFAAAYGATIPIVGEYAGSLQNDGETLSLVKPGPTSAQDLIIDEVGYASVFPWPITANGLGSSLQRIDPAQDSWRPGNWSALPINDPNRATPGRANANRASIEPFPQIWINEIVSNNQTGGMDDHGERDPWIELYNSGSTPVDLTLVYLSNDPQNPTKWQFPLGTTIEPGKFLLVWADGQPEQNIGTPLHTSFRLSPTGGVVALTRIQFGAPATIDYTYYPALLPDQSFGSIADGDPETRRPLFVPTPNSPNNPGDMLLPVTINEWMSSNIRVISDPADGDFDDWFELHNHGANPVDLVGYFLGDSTTNATQFRIPAGYTIPANGFLLVWADEESGQNDPTRADLHVNFKLSKDGDTLALFTPNGAVVDSISFTSQTDNVSGGRYPDSTEAIFAFGSPTPRAPNSAPAGTRFTNIAYDGAQLTIGWRTIVGRTYRLESRGDLNPGAWTPVGNNVTATGTTVSVNVNFSAASNQFFRVVQMD